jgi:hypothetical protein
MDRERAVRPVRSNKLTIKLVVAGLALAAGGLAPYWHMSPVLAIRSMRAASVAADADMFNNYVDYPKLRESLKGRLIANMAKLMEPKGGTSEGANGFAALGAVLGLAMINSVVDAMVRPEVVMQAMKDGKLGKGKVFEAPPPGPEAPATKASEPGPLPEWVTERKGMDKYVVHLREAGKPEDLVSLVFERSGIATWKLTELRPNFPS